MLGQRRKRWPDIDPALDHSAAAIKQWINIYPAYREACVVRRGQNNFIYILHFFIYKNRLCLYILVKLSESMLVIKHN